MQYCVGSVKISGKMQKGFFIFFFYLSDQFQPPEN